MTRAAAGSISGSVSRASKMLDLRIKQNGVKVRLVGFGPRKLINLRLLHTGLASMKARLAAGLDADDQKTKPLSKRYAIRKSKLTRKAARRDMRLTGAFLDTFQPRFADEQRSVAYAGGRLGRLKAILYRDLVNFSPTDIKAMQTLAAKLIKEEFKQVFEPLTGGGKSRGGAGRLKPATSFRQSTTFRQAA